MRWFRPASPRREENIIGRRFALNVQSLGSNANAAEFAMTEVGASEQAIETEAEPLRVNHRYTIKDPLGKTIEIPETAADDFAYFDAADEEGSRSY
jgi:hypothetical protein